MTNPTRPVPDRGSTALLAVVVPLLLTAGAFGWVSSFAGDLPDPVAVHWGVDGRADGFGSWQSAFLVIVVVAALVCGLAGVIGIGLGRASATRRAAVLVGMWSGIALPWFVAGSLYLQRGLTDASQAPDINLALLVSFVVAALLGGGAAALIPGDARQPARDAVPNEAARLPLADSELASWQRTVQIPGLWWLAVGGGLATAVLAALSLWRGASWAGLSAGIAGFLTVLLVALGRWQVVVDHTGLTVRPLLPRPRTRVALDEVVSAEVTSVSPARDFGGWGYRVGMDGQVGVVVRAGEAIRVQQTGGRTLVITVDDAATGAALLNTLADRARRR